MASFYLANVFNAIQSLNRCSKRYEGQRFVLCLFIQQLLFLASAILAHPEPAANRSRPSHSSTPEC